MKTIEVNGNPHNVDDAIASDILQARQNLENKKATKEAIGMAEAAMEMAIQPVEVMGNSPMWLDSADIAKGLHKDGLLDVLYFGEEEVFITPSFAQGLHNDGLLIEVHADAKCSGRGWMPGGPNGKCKRVPKGTAKKVKAETAGINRLAAGGNKNESRSARIAELRSKLGAKSAGKQKTANAANNEALTAMLDRRKGRDKTYARAKRANAQLEGLKNFENRAKAAGDPTSPKGRKKRKKR